MSASFEARKNTQAAMITAGFAGLMILLMFLLKWSLPSLIKPIAEETIEVNLNIPEDPPAKVLGGGGGGGNPVEAPEKAGPAPHTPPDPGVKEDSRDPETDDNDKAAPEIKKPAEPKPVKHVVENTSPVVKKEPKPVVEPPAPKPPVAKAVLGRTVGGNSNGGNEAATYSRNGGDGNGTGVGHGPGYGGNTGGGNGGGNGTGSGTGNGPKRVSGSRFVINPKNMDAGENLKGKVLAEISVSPDGVGTFVRTTRGSTYTSGEAIEIIREWLRRNRFDKKSEQSTVVY